LNIRRWSLHATLAVLIVSPLLVGWAWRFTPLNPPDAAGVAVVPVPSVATGPRQPESVLGPAQDDTAPDSALAAEPPLSERVQTYRVQVNDTLNELSQRFGISVDTLMWANSLRDPNRLLVGQSLTVLPVSGVLHTIVDGDTLVNLAQQYSMSLNRLVLANGLPESHELFIGQRLLVPDGRPLRAAPAARPSSSAPVTGGWPAPGNGPRQRQEFIQASATAAQETQRRTRIPASVTIAQAIHESYWGSSRLAREANNYFGIKAFGVAGSAGVYRMDAWEVVNGEDVIIPGEPFRAYASPADSFVDHGMFFLRNSRYHRALSMSDDPRRFAQAIADAGYATDPAYAAKLIRIMDQYDLYDYDLR
jgi:LysM repeat protein